MQHFSIPTCYFPSTALFIDDNRDFLLNFVLQLDEGLAYRVFDSPFDALECIQKKHDSLDLLGQRCLKKLSEIEETSLKDNKIPTNLASIHNEIYNLRRFDDISVVVVDYAMPGMNGLDFCRRINNTAIKIILLTGKADEKLAIDAFNEGLIHRYILKSDPDVADMITRSIYELQWQFFQDVSDSMVRLLSLESPPCMHDREFADFFREFCLENRIVEFYLADNHGSFLLLDDDANVSFLLAKPEEGAPTLSERIPSVDDQAAHFSVAGGTYLYSYVNGSALFTVQQDKIVSYHTHLQEIDAEELLLL